MPVKLAVVFPNVMHREGADGVTRLMQAIETIGYDELDMFDHVLMGYPSDTRRAPFYSPTMPIMEAFMTLAYAAAVTRRIGLGTGVLILPQRQPALVARQVSTLDTLSGGRVRLGIGSGWQRAEYETLNEDYASRGARMDEAIELLRACWRDDHINYAGRFYRADEIAMEPKPPQGGNIPIWIGGTRPPALRRVVRHGDGWMGMSAPGDAPLAERVAMLRRFAEDAGRDPASIGMQMALSPGPLERNQRVRFYSDRDLLRRGAAHLRDLGFDTLSIDCVPLFQQGFRSSEALAEQLANIHEWLSSELS